MTVIFVDIHRNSTENEALKVCHHWLQWEQNLLTSSHMAKFSDLPAGCWGNILSLYRFFLFSRIKASGTKISIIFNAVFLWKKNRMANALHKTFNFFLIRRIRIRIRLPMDNITVYTETLYKFDKKSKQKWKKSNGAGHVVILPVIRSSLYFKTHNGNDVFLNHLAGNVHNLSFLNG